MSTQISTWHQTQQSCPFISHTRVETCCQQSWQQFVTFKELRPDLATSQRHGGHHHETIWTNTMQQCMGILTSDFFLWNFFKWNAGSGTRGYPQGRVPPVSRICEPDSLRGPKQAQCLYFKDLRQKGGNVGNVMLVIHKSSLTIFWSIAMEKKGLEQNTKSWLVNLTLFIRFHNLTWHTLTIWCPVLLPLPLPV